MFVNAVTFERLKMCKVAAYYQGFVSPTNKLVQPWYFFLYLYFIQTTKSYKWVKEELPELNFMLFEDITLDFIVLY